MIKCAIITPGFLPVPATQGGAVETLITNLIESNEKEKKFNFDIFTIDSKENKDFKYKYSKIHVIKISKIHEFIDKLINKILSVFQINKYSSRYITLVTKKIKKNNVKYDYILIENNMYLYKEIIKNYRFKTKFIFHLHNDIGGRDKPIELCKLISNTTYKVLTVSDFLNKKFKQLTDCNCVETYYNCISVEKFLYNITKIDRRNLNLKKDDIVFMYTGRFSREKGLLELIISFKRICKKYSNVKLLVVGDDSGKDSYTKKIIKISKNLNDKIIFVGYVSNDFLVNYYKISDVIVIPSVCDEAFGIVALEAMLTKKSIIASNRGGIPEIVNSNCAILVEKNNFINELCSAMEKMINLKSELNSMGKIGYNMLISNKNFDADYYLKNFLNAIK